MIYAASNDQMETEETIPAFMEHGGLEPFSCVLTVIGQIPLAGLARFSVCLLLLRVHMRKVRKFEMHVELFSESKIVREGAFTIQFSKLSLHLVLSVN